MSRKLSSLGIPVVLVALAFALAGLAGAAPLAAPTITGFAPNHGLFGERVTIYGHDLAGAQVSFNGMSAYDAVVDPMGTHIVVHVPDEVATGPGAITVATPQGTVTSTTMFTVNPPSRPKAMPRPRIAGFAPMRGAFGTKVTIHGSRLGGALWVKIGGTRATFTVPLDSKIVAIVPRKAHSGTIEVRTRGGVAASGNRFVFLQDSGN